MEQHVVEDIDCSEYYKHHLPVEDRILRILFWCADKEEHTGYEIQCESQHAQRHELVQRREGHALSHSEHSEIHQQKHSKQDTQTDEVQCFARRPYPGVTRNIGPNASDDGVYRSISSRLCFRRALNFWMANLASDVRRSSHQTQR